MSRATFALLNLALIFGTFAVGSWLYFRNSPDTSGIRGSRLLGPGVRGWYFSNLVPFEDLFVHRGLPPAVLSYAQLAVSPLVALAYASGLIFTAGFLVLFTGTLDILDGKVARGRQVSSSAGAFLDSVIDRYAEFVTYGGLLVYFETGWQVWAVLLAIVGGSMVSYARARAEGLGARCDVGWLQRPERFVILGFGSIFSSVVTHAVGGSHELLAATIVVLAVLSNATAVQRITHVLAQLGERARA